MNKKMTKANLLLVEDDPNLSEVLMDFLISQGFRVTLALDGDEGLRVFHHGNFDLVLLDIMMPRRDGFLLAEEIRMLNENVPIIFLTAKVLPADKIRGFKAGCDDYITKPFSTEELSLRLDAILKRCVRVESEPDITPVEVFEIGQYRFDTTNFKLLREGNEISLTPKEGALLRLLCLNKNQLITREKALIKIWGTDDYFIGRSMDVFITRLRKYLKDDPNVMITNVHGTGFKLEVKIDNA
ncbi:MAG: response regulator transcription factor [Bacteroidota bacterium]|nr:response regulator transcription factor [Bacteroidota bacterium]